MTTTTDVTISLSSPAQTFLVRSNSATDGWFYPRLQVHGSTGSGLTYDGTYVVAEPPVAYGQLTLAVGQSTPTQTMTVKVYWGGR